MSVENECMWKGAGCVGGLVAFQDAWVCERHFPTGLPLPAPGAKERSDVALKFDKSKLRLDLIDPVVEEALAQILTFGAEKYGEWNWAKGFKWTRLYGALRRHMLDWYDSRGQDKETQASHLHHALCCLAFLVSHETRGLGEDDRPFQKKE